MSQELQARLLALPGAQGIESRLDGQWMTAPEIDVAAMAQLMSETEGRLSTITGIPLTDGETELIYHYVVAGQPINVRARTRANAIPSIANITQSANWIEREIHDIYGVDFQGHPFLERLLRPAQVLHLSLQ